MKAKDYYEKYVHGIFQGQMAADAIDDMYTMFKEFCTEAIDLCRTRHAIKDAAVAAVIREQNQKWNALERIFEEKHGFSPIKHDAFSEFWIKNTPQLQQYL